MDNILRLLAIEEICRLKARYFRFVDAKRWHDLRAIFTDDAQVHLVGVFGPLNIDEAMKRIIATLTDCKSFHKGFMPEVDVSSPTEASAIWGMEDKLRWPDPAKSTIGTAALDGSGYYYETYRKDHGHDWRIATLRLEYVHGIPKAQNTVASAAK
jgi:SnoaL-like domain